MDVLNDSTIDKPLIPGDLGKKTNRRLFYCNYISVGLTLVLILVITCITGAMVHKINETVNQSNEVIEDIKGLLPYADLAFEIREIYCNDTNRTGHHPKFVNAICNSTWSPP